MLAVGLAKYLHQLGLVTFDEEGASGDCFIAKLPPAPDEAVAIWPTGGPQADDRLGYDSPTVQILVRGTQDPRTGADRAQAIYDALHGRRFVTLPDGTEVLWIQGIQSAPQWLQEDENGRHIYALNLQLEVRAVGSHRE